MDSSDLRSVYTYMYTYRWRTIHIQICGGRRRSRTIGDAEAMNGCDCDDGGGRSASRTMTIGVVDSARVSERVEQCESESLRENRSWRQRGREIDPK
ncbi:unnamed protein product [Camellia sinensis]